LVNIQNFKRRVSKLKKIKLDDGREIEIKEPKQKHLVKYFSLLQKMSEDPDKITEYLEFQKEMIEELTGISKEEQSEMELATLEKIMDYIVDRMMGATGFARLWKQQQSLSQQAKAE